MLPNMSKDVASNFDARLAIANDVSGTAAEVGGLFVFLRKRDWFMEDALDGRCARVGDGLTLIKINNTITMIIIYNNFGHR